jgi:hypothetical protein
VDVALIGVFGAFAVAAVAGFAIRARYLLLASGLGLAYIIVFGAFSWLTPYPGRLEFIVRVGFVLVVLENIVAIISGRQQKALEK